jgi:hypothetical protein
VRAFARLTDVLSGAPYDCCMVLLMMLASEQHAERIELVLGGCRRDELRRAAVRACVRRAGPGEWRIREERFRPTMVSRAGSVRLWEGRFEMARS